jgi:4a-hydroxytetrahydrobiopterin dehydratase
MAMDDTAMTKQQVEAALAALPLWSYNGTEITRTYKTGGWRATLMLVNAIGYLAEAAWHHPDLSVSYASVEVRMCTHSAGGITAKDFDLAGRFERLATWRPADRPEEAPPLVL